MAYTYTVQRTIVSGYSVPGQRTATYPANPFGYGINLSDQFNACGHHSDAVITGIRISATWSGTPPKAATDNVRLNVQSFFTIGGSRATLDRLNIGSSGGSASITVRSSAPAELVYVFFANTSASTWPATVSISFTYTSATAPASTFTCGNATLGSSHTVTIQPAASSLSHRVTWSCGSNSHVENVASGTTSVSYTIPASWGSAFSSSNSGTLTVKLETIQGSTVTGTNSANKSVSVPSYSVSASLAASVVDGDNGQYAQYKSKARLTPTVSTSYGATISSCTITGHAISGSISGTGGGTTGVLTQSGNITYTLSVRDSRGKTATATRTISVISCGAVSVNSAPSITFGQTSTVKFTHTYLSRLTCTVKWAIGNQSHTETLSKGAGQASYTVPTSWANQEPNSLSGDITVTIVSRDENGATTGTATWHVIAYVPAYLPDLSIGVQVVDGYSGLYLQSVSKARFTASATTSYGATIRSYQWSGAKYVSGQTGSAFTTDVLDVAGNFEVTCKVTDSRGRTDTQQVRFTVTEYRKPQITNLSIYRSNTVGDPEPGGESLSMIAVFTWTDLGVNSLTTTAQVRNLTAGGGWETVGSGFTSGQLQVYLPGQLSRSAKYEVRILVSDDIDTQEASDRLTVGTTYMFWGENSMGFGAYPIGNDQVYISDTWKFYTHGKEIVDFIYPVGCVIMRNAQTDMAAEVGGTWSLLKTDGGIYYYSRTA